MLWEELATPGFHIGFSYIHQQIHKIIYKSYTSLAKCLHVSALRCHPQGIITTKEYKGQHIKLGNAMPSVQMLKILKKVTVK